MKTKINIIVALCIAQFAFAQKDIGTETINVVKPYTPTISDAFKVKETPSLDDNETTKKEEINYTIFSFPVASTFTPSKGRAAAVEKSKQEKYYSNYATLGAGNYANINAELFVTQELENNNYVGVMLRHLSSQGGIKNVELDDKFYNTSIDATYGSRAKDLSWNADIGFSNQIYNWYGIPKDFFTPAQLETISPKHTYNNVYLGGNLALDQSVFKGASIKFSRFFDDFSSGENRFVAKPKVEFDFLDEKIKADFVFDYINGSFEKDFYAISNYKYGFTNVGFSPSFNITKEDLSVNIGASFFYSVANANGENKFFVYPNITASLKIVGDLMIGYAGAEGTLHQNSYQDFANNNYFVSPTLNITPTDRKFDIYAGLKGKLANAVSYNIRGSLKNEDYKPMFISNIYDGLNTNTEGYTYFNSFNIIYDTVKTVEFFGELKADFSKNVLFGVNGTFSTYSLNNETEAWNLPLLQLASNIDFVITNKWYAGFKVFFTGERKDRVSMRDLTAVTPTYLTQTVKLDSYFDLNAHLGYKHNERLTFFLKGNNLANQNYQRWMNYPVQGINALIGVNYKFDF